MTETRRLWGRRWRRYLSMATAALVTSSLAGAAVAAPGNAEAYDLDRGNALIELVYPRYEKALRAAITPDGSDATLIADSILMVEVAWFDAIAPYHPTAVGIYSNLGRRPSGENTVRNKNIAVLYAAYTSLRSQFPQFQSDWRDLLESAGLDPDDAVGNTTTAAGIGTLAATKVQRARKHDGSNREGDEGTRRYNLQPFEDTTGYRPVNTAYELRDPSRWQPNTVSQHGVFQVQQFVTPHYGRVKPITYTSPAQFELSPPTASDHRDRTAYRRQAEEILATSARLTDRQKMTAEFFNDKVLSLGIVAGAAAVRAGGFDVEKTVQYVVSVDIAIFDVAITAWHFKRKYNAVRPFSAIRYLYGDKKVTAWGGPGKGTVSDITGNEWRSYMNTHDHPEYPSGTSAYCHAYAQAARRFLGTDKIDMSFAKPKGSSSVEPGVTPATDITLRWSSWTEMTRDCRDSRVWAGVHFRPAVDNVTQFAPQIGNQSYELVQRKLNGG